jgi:hypothetical protein
LTNPFTLRQQHGPPAPAQPLDFEIDGETFTLPVLGTRAWLEILTLKRPGCWWQAIPTALAGTGFTRLYARLVDNDDTFDIDDLESVAEQVLPHVLGVEIDAASRLASGAYGNWMLFDSWAATVGLDPIELPIPRLLAASYAWRRALCQETAELRRLDTEVFAPAPADTISGKSRVLSAEPEWLDEQEEAAFMGFLSNIGARAG